MVQQFLVLVSPFASQHGLIHGNSMPLKTNFSLINFFFFFGKHRFWVNVSHYILYVRIIQNSIVNKAFPPLFAVVA